MRIVLGNRSNRLIALSQHRKLPCYNLLQTPPLRGLGSGGRSTRVFAGPGFRDVVVSSLYVVIFPCYNMASGCPCLVMRATPFVYRAATRKLVPVAALRFGALTPCYGHGFDHRRRQSHHRSNVNDDKLATSPRRGEFPRCSLLQTLPLRELGSGSRCKTKAPKQVSYIPFQRFRNAGGLPPALGGSLRRNHRGHCSTASTFPTRENSQLAKPFFIPERRAA